MPLVGTPSLDQLCVLAAIVESGSFSAAARRLNRAQSVVSYSMAQLEAQLGVTIFERRGRRPVLTEAGRAILAEAQRVTGAVDALRARAAGLQQGLEAEVSVAVDVFAPVPALVCALHHFSREFPTVALRLRMEALGGPAGLVLAGECVIGLSGWACLPHSALHRRPVGEIALIPVAAPEHALAQGGVVKREAARDHVQLVLADASKLTDGQDFGVVGLKTWRLGDLAAKHALLLAGLGWGNMPAHLVAGDIAAGRLKRLRIEGEPAEHANTMFLIHRADRAPGRAAAWLSARLGEMIMT